jgi:predicted nucleic acid-binding protein
MSEQKPKKPRQKSKRLNLSTKAQWESILRSVEKKEIPIAFLESVAVNLADGTIVNINIKELLDEGNDPDLLEKMLKTKLSALDYIIEDIDFYISVAAVQKAVQPVTDELLKNL